MSNHTINPKHYHGKPCAKCGEALRYKSGNCVSCSKLSSRLWAKNNPGKVSKIRRRWNKNNPDKVLKSVTRWQSANKEKVSTIKRQWREANREKANESSRRWRDENREKYRETARAWAKNNPDNCRSNTRRYRAIKRNAISKPYDFKAICTHYGNRCLRCGADDKKLTVDHIKPLALGGNDIASNIQPLCQSCNSSKNARYIDYRPDDGPKRWTQKELLK